MAGLRKQHRVAGALIGFDAVDHGLQGLQREIRRDRTEEFSLHDDRYRDRRQQRFHAVVGVAVRLKNHLFFEFARQQIVIAAARRFIIGEVVQHHVATGVAVNITDVTAIRILPCLCG